MTTTELHSFREQLLHLKDRLHVKVCDLGEEALRRNRDSNLSHLPLHLADLGTDNFEQEVTISLLENGEQTLAETAAALARIEAQTFGRCEECQTEIPRARLEALPYTRHCIDCARELERTFSSTRRR
jgi:DnaK suppressor protein